MKHKRLKVVLAIFCVFLLGNVNALELNVVQSSISFSQDAEPITIELQVLDKGKLQRWDSSTLRAVYWSSPT